MRTGLNIRKRKDGLYEARYIKGRTEEGRIVYGSVYGKTLEAAAAKRQAERDKMTVRNNPPRQAGLIILGAGSHGAEVKEIAKMLRVFGRIDFLDDDTSKEGVIGTWQDAAKFRESYGCAIVAVGNRKLREFWLSRLTEMGYVIPTLVHPTAVISESAQIGAGTVVCANATIGTNAKLGVGCIISSSVTVARGATVEDWSHIDTSGIVRIHGGEADE